jgi:hypothetical protein
MRWLSSSTATAGAGEEGDAVEEEAALLVGACSRAGAVGLRGTEVGDDD